MGQNKTKKARQAAQASIRQAKSIMANSTMSDQFKKSLDFGSTSDKAEEKAIKTIQETKDLGQEEKDAMIENVRLARDKNRVITITQRRPYLFVDATVDLEEGAVSLMMQVASCLKSQGTSADILKLDLAGNGSFRVFSTEDAVIGIRTLNNAIFRPDSGKEILPIMVPLASYRMSERFVAGVCIMATRSNLKIASECNLNPMTPDITALDQNISQGLAIISYLIDGLKGQIYIAINEYDRLPNIKRNGREEPLKNMGLDILPGYLSTRNATTKLQVIGTIEDAKFAGSRFVSDAVRAFKIDEQASQGFVDFSDALTISSNNTVIAGTNDDSAPITGSRRELYTFEPQPVHTIAVNPIAVVIDNGVENKDYRGKEPAVEATWKLIVKPNKLESNEL